MQDNNSHYDSCKPLTRDVCNASWVEANTFSSNVALVNGLLKLATYSTINNAPKVHYDSCFLEHCFGKIFQSDMTQR